MDSSSNLQFRFEDLQPKWDWFRIIMIGIPNILGFACTFNPKPLPQRVGYIFFFFGSMLFYITVGSVFIIFTTIPFYESPIDSVKEILSLSFDLKGDGLELKYLNQINQVNEINF